MSASWTRDRDTSAENENAAAAVPRARVWRLTAVDRCDRCGAQAYVRVLLPGRLELLFCAHHNRQYSSALAPRPTRSVSVSTSRSSAEVLLRCHD